MEVCRGRLGSERRSPVRREGGAAERRRSINRAGGGPLLFSCEKYLRIFPNKKRARSVRKREREGRAARKGPTAVKGAIQNNRDPTAARMPRQYKTVGIDHRDPNLWIASYNKADRNLERAFSSRQLMVTESPLPQNSLLPLPRLPKTTVASNDDDDDATDEDEDAFEIDSSDSEVVEGCARARLRFRRGRPRQPCRRLLPEQRPPADIPHRTARHAAAKHRRAPRKSPTRGTVLCTSARSRAEEPVPNAGAGRLQPDKGEQGEHRRSAAADATAEQQGRKRSASTTRSSRT